MVTLRGLEVTDLMRTGRRIRDRHSDVRKGAPELTEFR